MYWNAHPLQEINILIFVVYLFLHKYLFWSKINISISLWTGDTHWTFNFCFSFHLLAMYFTILYLNYYGSWREINFCFAKKQNWYGSAVLNTNIFNFLPFHQLQPDFVQIWDFYILSFSLSYFFRWKSLVSSVMCNVIWGKENY